MNCKHLNLPTNKFLVQCEHCKEYFVIKEQFIIAASNGGKTGLIKKAYPSNFLGWTCGDEFTLPA